MIKKTDRLDYDKLFFFCLILIFSHFPHPIRFTAIKGQATCQSIYFFI